MVKECETVAIVITSVAASHFLAMTVLPKKNCARVVQFWKDLKKLVYDLQTNKSI